MSESNSENKTVLTVAQLKDAFKEGATPNETHYHNLINLAAAGAVAAGKDLNTGKPDPGPGLKFGADGKLSVKEGPGVKVTENGGVSALVDNVSICTTDNKLAVRLSGPDSGLALNGGLHVLTGDGIRIADGVLAVDLANESGLVLKGETKKSLAVNISEASGLDIGTDNAVKVKIATGDETNYLQLDNNGLSLTDAGISKMTDSLSKASITALDTALKNTQNGFKTDNTAQKDSVRDRIATGLNQAYKEGVSLSHAREAFQAYLSGKYESVYNGKINNERVATLSPQDKGNDIYVNASTEGTSLQVLKNDMQIFVLDAVGIVKVYNSGGGVGGIDRDNNMESCASGFYLIIGTLNEEGTPALDGKKFTRYAVMLTVEHDKSVRFEGSWDLKDASLTWNKYLLQDPRTFELGYKKGVVTTTNVMTQKAKAELDETVNNTKNEMNKAAETDLKNAVDNTKSGSVTDNNIQEGHEKNIANALNVAYQMGWSFEKARETFSAFLSEEIKKLSSTAVKDSVLSLSATEGYKYLYTRDLFNKRVFYNFSHEYLNVYKLEDNGVKLLDIIDGDLLTWDSGIYAVLGKLDEEGKPAKDQKHYTEYATMIMITGKDDNRIIAAIGSWKISGPSPVWNYGILKDPTAYAGGYKDGVTAGEKNIKNQAPFPEPKTLELAAAGLPYTVDLGSALGAPVNTRFILTQDTPGIVESLSAEGKLKMTGKLPDKPKTTFSILAYSTDEKLLFGSKTTITLTKKADIRVAYPGVELTRKTDMNTLIKTANSGVTFSVEKDAGVSQDSSSITVTGSEREVGVDIFMDGVPCGHASLWAFKAIPYAVKSLWTSAIEYRGPGADRTLRLEADANWPLTATRYKPTWTSMECRLQAGEFIAPGGTWFGVGEEGFSTGYDDALKLAGSEPGFDVRITEIYGVDGRIALDLWSGWSGPEGPCTYTAPPGTYRFVRPLRDGSTQAVEIRVPKSGTSQK